MIATFGKNGYDEHYQYARTDGCSCCSTEYNLNTEQDKIKEELKDNIVVVFRLCAAMGWNADELIEKVRDEGKWKNFKEW